MPDTGSWIPTVAALVTERPWLAVVVLVVLVALLRLAGRRRGPAPRPGEVWFAMVPFEDGSGAKDRPVLVLSSGVRRCTVARMTSQDRSARSDHARVPTGTPGIARASWINLRPTTVRRSAFRRRSGTPGEAFVAWYREVATDRP